MTSKEQEYEARAQAVKRLAFVVLGSELDQYQAQMNDIQGGSFIPRELVFYSKVIAVLSQIHQISIISVLSFQLFGAILSL